MACPKCDDQRQLMKANHYLKLLTDNLRLNTYATLSAAFVGLVALVVALAALVH